MLDIFMAIPDAPDAEEADFYDVDVDGLPPRMFLPSGDPYTPPGPVRLEEITRKRRVRYVKVNLYRFVQTEHGLAMIPYTVAYGWQGDNGLVHLYETPKPLGELPPPVDLKLSESYGALMRAMGYMDWFIDS